MFDKLEILQMAQGMASHAAARHSVLARNIAHADTPGYRARDVASFSETYRQQGGFAAQATRAGHFRNMTSAVPREFVVPGAEISPNGNSVTIETEMVKAVEATRQHSRAVTIYKTSLDILRSSIGR